MKLFHQFLLILKKKEMQQKEEREGRLGNVNIVILKRFVIK
jgi:hypothetical protein